MLRRRQAVLYRSSHQLAYGSLKVADGELDKVACKIHRTGENSPVSHDKP